MIYRVPAALGASLTGLACLLAGCSARTDVSLTGNTPARFSHVWLTTQEIWVNASATAGPDDSGWRKFPLSTPATVDLVGQNGGTLGSIVTGLNIEPGTYSQLRVIPVDSSAALTASAQTAGAIFNAEADFVDGGGTTHQLPLEMLNPEKGIGIATSLRVPVGNVGAAVGAATSGIGTGTTTGTDASFVNASGSSPFATTTTSTGTTTITAGSLTPTSTTTGGTTTLGMAGTTPTGTGTTRATPPPNEFAIAVNGSTDLVPFSFSGASGIMLSSHATAFDLTRVGAISGTLTLTNLSSSTGTSGLPAIEASAEVLSADGSRHVVVSSTPVHADGTFMLYPLAAGSSSNSPDDYDVVIHGPGIATIIIKGVQVFQASATSTTTVPTATTQGTMGVIDTNTTTTSTTSGTSSPSTTITPVSLGTLLPRAATSYSANLTRPTTPLPAGAAVSFYQTLQGKSEVPYVIETAAIDPFNQNLATAQSLSTGTVDSGTWSSSGASITVVSAAPAQGAGGYVVATTAPSFADGALTTKVSAPSSTSTTPVLVPALPAMQFASGVSQGSVSATVTVASTANYDHGDLLLTHNGALVASTPIDAVIKAGGSVTLSAVPARTPAAVYYVAVRAWNSGTGNVHRQSVTGALDMTSSTTGAVELTLN